MRNIFAYQKKYVSVIDAGASIWHFLGNQCIFFHIHIDVYILYVCTKCHCRGQPTSGENWSLVLAVPARDDHPCLGTTDRWVQGTVAWHISPLNLVHTLLCMPSMGVASGVVTSSKLEPCRHGTPWDHKSRKMWKFSVLDPKKYEKGISGCSDFANMLFLDGATDLWKKMNK